MRIVAGKWRSRLLDVADVPGLRPTPIRIRETLFNWLASRIQGARCLDLYAGTGALGIEALSRGAASGLFIERDAAALSALRKNLAALGADNATVEAADVRDWLGNWRGQPYDVVFLDPPYANASTTDLCRLLERSGCLADGARVYFEHDRNDAPSSLPPGWTVEREGIAGQVRYVLAAV